LEQPAFNGCGGRARTHRPRLFPRADQIALDRCPLLSIRQAVGSARRSCHGKEQSDKNLEASLHESPNVRDNARDGRARRLRKQAA
jgi:hypothetical protein